MHNRLSSIWHDPVWSKVIAGAILAALTLVFLPVLRRLLPSISALSRLSAWTIVFLGLTLIGLLLVSAWSRRKPKTLVFLSAGGTCRDPMAKAIMAKLLQCKKLKHPVDIRAAGLGPLAKSEASYAARYVINEMYNENLLKHHQPELLTPELSNQADLILVMDKSLLTTPGKTLPSGKTFLIKAFFGKQGDVCDPWPDGKDDATLARYRMCAEELRQLLTENVDRITRILDL